MAYADMNFRSLSLLAACLLIFLCAQQPAASKETASEKKAIPVTVSPEGMSRGGRPYFVKGAGGDSNLKQLAERGANSIRTWTSNDLGEILDEAHSLGLTVSIGIWLEDECSWFSYHNPEHLAKQNKRVREAVLKYRDHPALLAWGLGNEVKAFNEANTAFWQQLDQLAILTRELDPHHPTFTALAGFDSLKLESFDKHAPNLDFLGINTYGGAGIVRKELERHGLKRPWLLTEWGTRGPWESKKTSFKAVIEPTSTEKSNYIRKTYKDIITPTDGLLGSYVFLWGWKHEATSSWFGLLTFEKHPTSPVDVLEEMWSGKTPSNRSPNITPITGVPPKAIKPGETFQATVTAEDPDKDNLTYKWMVLPELSESQHHTNSKFPKAVADAIKEPTSPSITVTAPSNPGIYRLYIWAADQHQHTATANMPFEVRQ